MGYLRVEHCRQRRHQCKGPEAGPGGSSEEAAERVLCLEWHKQDGSRRRGHRHGAPGQPEACRSPTTLSFVLSDVGKPLTGLIKFSIHPLW